MADVSFFDGADSVSSKVPAGLSETMKTSGGPVEFFDGADKASGAHVPAGAGANEANVSVGKGNLVTGPMDK